MIGKAERKVLCFLLRRLEIRHTNGLYLQDHLIVDCAIWLRDVIRGTA